MFCQEIRLMYSYAFDVSPSLLHNFSIDTPSKLWTIYGVSVEYVWSIFEGRAKNLHIFFEEITPLLLGRNGKKEKRKSPHRQGVTKNNLEVWGMLYDIKYRPYKDWGCQQALCSMYPQVSSLLFSCQNL